MTASRLLAPLALVCVFAMPVGAQTAKPASVTARLDALEKENATLREDVARLQALLTQTRRDLIVMEGARVTGGSFYVPPVGSTLGPMSVGAQQAQTNAAIQNQNVNQQLNNMQLNQQLMQDRARDQALFQPAPGSAP